MTARTILTVAEAAKRVGKSRQTVFDKIKRGQLSATINGDGNKVVDVSELLRVFGNLLSDDEVKKNQANKSVHTIALPLTSTLQLELERAKLMLERKDFELEQMRVRVEEMRERERENKDEKQQLLTNIERQTLLLAAPKPARQKAASAPAQVARKAQAKPATLTKEKAKPAAAKKATAVQKAPTRQKTVAKHVAKATRKRA